jgi:hypothetical protein
MANETNVKLEYTDINSSTIYTYLCYDKKYNSIGTDSDTNGTIKNAYKESLKNKPNEALELVKVADIKDFPALGGAPETIETTTLSDNASTFVTGVQSVDAFEFTANYTAASFSRLKSMQAKNDLVRFYLVFGKKEEGSGETKTIKYGEYGIFYWNGTISCWLDSGSVNGVRQIKMSISSATTVEIINEDDGASIKSIDDPNEKETTSTT